MKKYLHLVIKVIFSTIIVLPVVSLLGILMGADIQPKPEYYTTPEAYEFIRILMNSMYITVINSVVFTLGLILLWTKRVALAALLIFPITVNIVGFHAFLDGGLLTSGALMGNVMLFINLYYLWQHREVYQTLWAKR
jgi:TctA family transporter